MKRKTKRLIAHILIALGSGVLGAVILAILLLAVITAFHHDPVSGWLLLEL